MMSTLNGQISNDQMERGEDLREVSYDAVYVDRLANPKLFDIIVVQSEEIDPKTQKQKNVIKRLMALEGDYVTIAKSQDANGQEHFYLFRIPAGSDFSSFTDDMARLEESGENGYEIYKRDNWDVSKTETQEVTVGSGTHKYEEIFFNTFIKGYFSEEPTYNYYVSDEGLIYVQVPQGKFFYLGDNRGHSDDARKNGFGNVSSIVGRTEFIVYNYNFGNRLWEVIKFYFSEMDKFFAR